MKVFKVRVTAKDIACGDQRSLSSCPVAIALKRDTGILRLEVDGGWVTTWKNDEKMKVPLPTTAWAWVRHFDAEGPTAVAPINFVIAI